MTQRIRSVWNKNTPKRNNFLLFIWEDDIMVKKEECPMSHHELPHEHHSHSHELLHQLPAEGDFTAMAELFRLLGDSSRLRLFWILCHCEECVVNLSAMMEMSPPALSHHLRQLKASGLIVSRRAGKEVYYRAAATAPVELLHHIMEELNHVVCPACGSDVALPSTPQADRIKAVHQLLTTNLHQRYTIEALSKQFYLDSSTLKREFRRVYGLPIATYLKEYRIQKAMQLLEHTDESIAAIATQVGYETQSKFAAAFKAATRLSPSAYRKNCRK